MIKIYVIINLKIFCERGKNMDRREKIEKTAHECGFFNTILAENLEEAIKICAEKAEAGDAVLLSPACASWGQFDNYEQRGDKFKEYVRAML